MLQQENITLYWYLLISKSFLVKIQQSSPLTTFVFRGEDCLVENFHHLHPMGYVDTNMVGHVRIPTLVEVI